MTESSAVVKGENVPKHGRDRTLVLHIGLHKTATTFVQNVLDSCRHDLLRVGVLYPETGTPEPMARTREGAQSGHALFTRIKHGPSLVSDLLAEMPDSVSTVLLSAEDFSLPRARPTAQEYLSRFSKFGVIKVVLVLRRQDAWVESWYKQLVDQYVNFETRSFDDFLRDEGAALLDFHTRFTPWRELVGPENFHVLSYDDLACGAAICRRLLEIAGVKGPLLDEAAAMDVPRYGSGRAVDTLGLRILNSYRLANRDDRIDAARAIYRMSPAWDLELMTEPMRAGIQAYCAPINERIESEWFSAPVPGFRFGVQPRRGGSPTPSGTDVVDYLDRVLLLCERVRAQGLQATDDRAEVE